MPFNSQWKLENWPAACSTPGMLRAGRSHPGILALLVLLAALPALCGTTVSGALDRSGESLLKDHLLVTWYGNPHTTLMGVLGQSSGDARAADLLRHADGFRSLTPKTVLPAYHLVTVVAQPHAGGDGMYRRRESADSIRALLTEARAHGFHLVLDIQPGRSDVESEIAYLRPFLREPDVHLALDPEFDMSEGQVPGRELGHMHAADVNAAIAFLDALITECRLPPKALVVHQFTLGMLPDKEKIKYGRAVDLVLDMDGFGSRALKLSSYRAVMRQRPLQFAGIKLFFRQDRDLLSPARVMGLSPTPSVVIYQ